jgi:hypothetical protein
MVNPFFKWRTVALATTIVVSLVCASGYPQQQQQQQEAAARQRAKEDREFQTAANKWMKAPVNLGTQPNPVLPGEREPRDTYFDNLIGASVPLSDPNAQERPLPIGDAIASAPEFGDLGDGVLVIGKFESYRTVLSRSQRSVYTEIQLRVQHVFGRPNAPTREGELIDLIRPGGTVIAPWGSTLSFGLHPEQMGLQPQHTYLIRLGYSPSGNFYLGGYRTGELWDLTDGTVKPGNSLQKHRAEHGMSEINGLSVDALIRVLDKRFDDYQRGH